MREAANPRIEGLLRELAPQALGAVMRQGNDFGASEDAVQEALIAAADQWPRRRDPGQSARLADPGGGAPPDRSRAERNGAPESRGAVGMETPLEIAPAVYDEAESRLRRHARAALHVLPSGVNLRRPRLRSLCAPWRPDDRRNRQGVSRARNRPSASASAGRSRASRPSGIPFRMPRPRGTGANGSNSVLHVLYLVFNEGYTSTSGQRCTAPTCRMRRSGSCARFTSSLPDDRRGRRTSRADAADRRAARGPDRTGRHELIPLDEQDRTRWDRQSIAEGVALVSAALSKGLVGEYQLQAAIAAVHDEAASAAETDWPQILALYSVLKRMTDNPMVAVSHAIATAMVTGPNAGLELLEPPDG